MTHYQVTVAPNGARRQKSDHPELPVTPQELAITAGLCQAAGASALHLHVRDDAGGHSLDAGRYRVAMTAVREGAPGMGIQITTESAGIYQPEAQLACLEALRPEAASVAVREMARAPEIAARAYALSAEAGTQVQHILYSPSCIAQLNAWYAAGIVPEHKRDVIFVLGKYEPATPADPGGLAPFAAAARKLDLNWSLCAFGRAERACLLAAIEAGGNVRIGFENNLETPEGALLKDNAASVAGLVKAAFQAGHVLKRN
ncbi:3-keto-5-aminohexanoate cleavage protein [Pseudophaeobacter sp.]|uniref:3-keto-5-aminohexanoate cleavage protein n=1 Tax=Pseudophaeobacter sp. TaxID=1971739 RepID=UPI003298480C